MAGANAFTIFSKVDQEYAKDVFDKQMARNAARILFDDPSDLNEKILLDKIIIQLNNGKQI